MTPVYAVRGRDWPEVSTMQRSEFTHFLQLPIRWGDMDAFGHVNNVQYLRYLESGRVAYIEDVLQTRMEGDENVILADIQCSFIQPLHYPAMVEVATRTRRLGGSSIHIVCAIYRRDEAWPVATGKAVMVWYDYRNQRPVPIPEQMRAAIIGFETVPPEV
jgi:acyl-CoA thioester hydrolase